MRTWSPAWPVNGVSREAAQRDPHAFFPHRTFVDGIDAEGVELGCG